MARSNNHKSKTPIDRKFFREAINNQELSGTLPESDTIAYNNQPNSFEATTDKTINDEDKIKKPAKRRKRKKPILSKIKTFILKNWYLIVIAIIVPIVVYFVNMRNDVSITKDKILIIEDNVVKLGDINNQQNLLINENSVEIRNIKERLNEKSNTNKQ